jgi:transcriptional regulator with XRE-family HTH domain
VLYLKFRRIELRLTQRAVAKKARISTSWLSQIESGRVNPTPDELAGIGKVLDCPTDRLLDHVSGEAIEPGGEFFDAQREVSRG